MTAYLASLEACGFPNFTAAADFIEMPTQGYYQEAGRAGRDGKHSECVLLYAAGDIPRLVRLLRGGRGRSKAKFTKGMELLNKARWHPALFDIVLSTDISAPLEWQANRKASCEPNGIFPCSSRLIMSSLSPRIG